jgi:hypothetical protein
MPDVHSRAPGASTSSRACRFLVATWALWAAAASVYLFIWSTMPVSAPDEPPLWGPDWLNTSMDFLTLSALAGTALLVPVLIAGLIYLSRTARATWPWAAAWVLVGVAAIAVEAMYVTGFAVPFVVPTYTGPAVVSWVSLFEAVGFLVTGGALIGVLIAVDRSKRKRQFR